jgi:hypothetical protein
MNFPGIGLPIPFPFPDQKRGDNPENLKYGEECGILTFFSIKGKISFDRMKSSGRKCQ